MVGPSPGFLLQLRGEGMVEGKGGEREGREDFSCTHVDNPGRNLNPKEMGRSEGLNTSYLSTG